MKYYTKQPALLLLEDGSLFKGSAIGYKGTHGGEICFNTGMTGYQEIYTDPSYTGQVIINTNAHIGNYGVFDLEQESAEPTIAGIVVSTFSQLSSRYTATDRLQNYLEKHRIVGIADVDTRQLVRKVRREGAMNCLISSEIFDEEELMSRLRALPHMKGLELSSQVSTQKVYTLGEGNDGKRVAVLDYGIKKSILTNLTHRNCQVKVFPAKTSLTDIMDWQPEGFFLSNGPGDPAAMSYAVDTTRAILETNKPVFGICLGHQLLAQACHIPTYKMHHGHRGLNHPVKNLLTGRTEVTSQNHGFAVDGDALRASKELEVTHINLNDDTIEGFRFKNKPAFSVQYHPEAAPGPHDARYLFDDFIELLNA
jgi:carbamoyl-phosphate synthase small subunit